MHIVEWAKEHPYEAGGIGLVGALVVLYMLGYIGGGSGASSGSAAASNVAAYYAAEAAQSQASSAVQIATIQTAAQTAQAQAQYGAAEQIASDQTYQNIYQAFATAQTADTASANNLAATQSNNAAAVQENAQNNAWATQQHADAVNGNILTDWIDKILAPEVGTGNTFQSQAPTVGNSYSANNPSPNPNGLSSVGYSPTQIDHVIGVMT